MIILPEKTPEIWQIFEEVFPQDIAQSGADVRKHLKTLAALEVSKVFARFPGIAPKAKNKGDRIEALVELFEAWDGNPPPAVAASNEITIAKALAPIEAEVMRELSEAKTAAENKLLAVKQMKFKDIPSEDVHNDFSKALKDLGKLAGQPDAIRKEVLKPLSDTLSGIQKVLKKWREPFDKAIAERTKLLKDWASAHIEKADKLARSHSDRESFLLGAIADIEQYVQFAEKISIMDSPDLVEDIFKKWREEGKGSIGGLLRESLGEADYAQAAFDQIQALVLFMSSVSASRKKELNPENTMEDAIGAYNDRTTAIASLKEASIQAIAELRAMANEEKKLASKAKPKTQMGLRRVLSVSLLSFAPTSEELGSGKFSIDAEMMEDPEVNKAITKYILVRLKQDGISPGDDLKEYENRFGESVCLDWRLE